MGFNVKHRGNKEEDLELRTKCIYTYHKGSIYYENKRIEMSGTVWGGIESRTLELESTLNTTLRILSARTSDPRVELVLNPQRKITYGKVNIGHIKFDAYQRFRAVERRDKSAEQIEHRGRQFREKHIFFWKRKNYLWDKLGRSHLDAYVLINTDIIPNINITFKGTINKHSSITKEEMDFGFVAEGNIVTKRIELNNPSSLPMDVEFFLSNIPLEEVAKYIIITNNSGIISYNKTTAGDTSILEYLKHIKATSKALKSNSGNKIESTSSYTDIFNNKIYIEGNEQKEPRTSRQNFFLEGEAYDTSFRLDPNSINSIRAITYFPVTLDTHHAYLLIKNNLTHIYQVNISGTGAAGRLQLLNHVDIYIYIYNI